MLSASVIEIEKAASVMSCTLMWALQRVKVERVRLRRSLTSERKKEREANAHVERADRGEDLDELDDELRHRAALLAGERAVRQVDEVNAAVLESWALVPAVAAVEGRRGCGRPVPGRVARG